MFDWKKYMNIPFILFRHRYDKYEVAQWREVVSLKVGQTADNGLETGTWREPRQGGDGNTVHHFQYCLSGDLQTVAPTRPEILMGSPDHGLRRQGYVGNTVHHLHSAWVLPGPAPPSLWRCHLTSVSRESSQSHSAPQPATTNLPPPSRYYRLDCHPFSTKKWTKWP